MKGFAFLIVLLIVGIIASVGASGYVVAKNFGIFDKPRKIENLNAQSANSESQSIMDKQADEIDSPSPTPSTAPQGGTGGGGTSTIYTQPQGKYTLTLPAGWVVNNTTSASTYSTTKFTGSTGSISVTMGPGKDPAGGCSENSSVTLFDRSVPGCFLLQKDGSQILTRTYTKGAGGIEFTIEAYMNPPLSISRPVMLETLKSIDIL